MSRPFSYNDENFTVIGNVLFCHIKVNKPISQFGRIVEIPPAIYDRMVNKANKVYTMSTMDDISDVFDVAVGVTKSSSDGKYYLYSNIAINITGNYLIGYFILKDI